MSDSRPKFLKPSETLSFLDRDAQSSIETTDFIYNRNISRSLQAQRQSLPIFNNRNHILYLLEKYQTLVLVGETGCGKSTQIPQMMGPSSQVSKFLVTLLGLVLLYYIFMDYNLYMRLKNYPVIGDNNTMYGDVAWISCDVNPLCEVTVKAVLLDHTNYYLFAPLVTILDNLFKISDLWFVTPNGVSFFHIFVAVLSAKCVSSDSLAYRRVGVVLFEFRTWLDDLDGHIARARKHIKGEHSEIGTVGYYIDGLCDAIGCAALLVGIFAFLKNNPPRRGYVQLPTSGDGKTSPQPVSVKLCLFTMQLVVSSAAWNRYIALYQDLLENKNVTVLERHKQETVFKSSLFYVVSFLWRVVNVHSMTHLLLLAIFCDKLWEFLCLVRYIGFGILASAICVTEVYYAYVKSFIFEPQTIR